MCRCRLLGDLMRSTEGSPGEMAAPLAFGVDTRTYGFDATDLVWRLQQLRVRPDLAARLLYLDCDTETLQRRYTESRRRHPMAPDRPVVDGIVDERRQIAWMRDSADVVIDTSALSPHQFKQILSGHFALEAEPGVRISVMSFSYRRGVPREADLVFDVRFPQEPALRARSEAAHRHGPGRGRPHRHRPRLRAVHRPARGPDRAAAAPLRREGKSYLTIAVGCTGGKHRSVAVAGATCRLVANHGPFGHPDASRYRGPGRSGRGKWLGQGCMIGIVLVTHGNLAREFLAALEHVVGPQQCISAVCIGADDDMEKRRNEILERARACDTGDGVIVLTDMFGGTPSNLAISIMEHARIEVLAGVNLPMLVKLASVRSRPIGEAVRMAQEAGRKYITVASRILAKEAS
jgi:RNase adaptor protein for sRNA GlmZ degradation/mannose/fructose-specific phosphotransferase system component IIA